MEFKGLALMGALLGETPSILNAQDIDSGQYSIGEVTEDIPHTIGNIIAGVYFVEIEPDCHINTTLDNTVVHCRKEDSIQTFLDNNGIKDLSPVASLLNIQGVSVMRTLEDIENISQKVGGVLKTTPPYSFTDYPNATRVCVEINNPKAIGTIGGIFINTDSNPGYDALITGRCTGVNNRDEFNIDQLALVYPGYSITLPNTNYDCAVYKHIYNCRFGVNFPFITNNYHFTWDAIQIQYPGKDEKQAPRLDISYTYTINMNEL